MTWIQRKEDDNKRYITQAVGFYNPKRRSFRQARRKMAGNSEYRARDVRVTGARSLFAFGRMANPAQRAIRYRIAI